MLAGDAPNALNIEVHSGLGGTRILKPLKSSGVLIGCVLLVTCRYPLSQILSSANRPDSSIALRTYRQVNSAASPRFETMPKPATPVAAVVVRKNTRRVILVMGDLLCSRFDRWVLPIASDYQWRKSAPRRRSPWAV